MPEFSLQLLVFLTCVGLYTIAAAIWDIRIKKIPNKLTLPVFGLGLLYQVAFNQWAGLVDGMAGFGVGFGLLFVIWMIGGGGGGDVKLMGALSVWLGFKLTLFVLVASAVLSMFLTFGIITYSFMTRGNSATKRKFFAQVQPKGADGKRAAETVESRMKRRPTGFAVPVALATWLVVLFYLPQWPFVKKADAVEKPNAVSARN